MSQKLPEHLRRREAAHRQELIERVQHGIREDGRVEPFEGLFLARATRPMEPVYGVVEPSFCVIVQGRKEVSLGEQRYQYDPYHYLLGCLEVPVVFRVLEASSKKPYLGLRLNISPDQVISVLAELEQLAPQQPTDTQAIKVSPMDFTLLDAVVRLVRLIDTPEQAPFLLPLISREIIYLLLSGEQGDRLRRMTLVDGHTTRIAQAVEAIRQRFNEPLRMNELASGISMSVSSFHHHFKAITAMTPLQFQKQLRLREARRLMLGEYFDATTAGSRVGYDDTSHFNRDYKRFFGAPPMRDVERIREAAGNAG